jgi:riboflavin synthase
MFTGIVEPGTVDKAKRRTGVLELRIKSALARGLEPGDSVSVNGVCLTARKVRGRHFTAQATNETVGRSTFARLRRGRRVNIELPLRMGDRLGGHLVQGHVDSIARVRKAEGDGDSRRLWFEAAPEMLRYVVPKGSVALDGVSLTVVDVTEDDFEVMIIPHTLNRTTLGTLRFGDEVNMEIDVMAKYAERLAGRD